MRNCLTCPLRALCRRVPANLAQGAAEFWFGEDTEETAERVLGALSPNEIERIAKLALIEIDPETDCRAIAKEELIAAIEEMNWTRPALQ